MTSRTVKPLEYLAIANNRELPNADRQHALDKIMRGFALLPAVKSGTQELLSQIQADISQTNVGRPPTRADPASMQIHQNEASGRVENLDRSSQAHRRMDVFDLDAAPPYTNSQQVRKFLTERTAWHIILALPRGSNAYKAAVAAFPNKTVVPLPPFMTPGHAISLDSNWAYMLNFRIQGEERYGIALVERLRLQHRDCEVTIVKLGDPTCPVDIDYRLSKKIADLHYPPYLNCLTNVRFWMRD